MEKHNWWFYDQKKERTGISISTRECFRLSLCKLKGTGWVREITNNLRRNLFNFYRNLISSSDRFHNRRWRSRCGVKTTKIIKQLTRRIVKVEHKMSIMTGKLSVRSVWGRNDAKMLAAGAHQIPSRKLKSLARKNYHLIEFHSRRTRRRRRKLKSSSTAGESPWRSLWVSFRCIFDRLGSQRKVPLKICLRAAFRLALNARWFILHHFIRKWVR